MLISDLYETRTIVLAIGDGRNLAPLTERRALAALPFGGNYRIVDFALTNCLHSGLRRVIVLTNYNSLSLANHLRDGWSIFNTDLGEYVMPVSPPVRDSALSYSGSANALFHNRYLLEGATEPNVMIVSGEQIYRMDYAAALQRHADSQAAITVVGIDARRARETRAEVVMHLRDESELLAISANDDGDEAVTTPMGIFIFNRRVLIDLLERRGEAGTRDSGLVALCADALKAGLKVGHYRFGGTTGRVTPDQYWRTLPSLDAYFEANMDLLRLDPLLDLYQADWPIRSYQVQVPPARTVPGHSCNEGICVNSIIAGGVVIAGGGVNHSVLSHRVYIDDSATVEESILYPGVRVGESVRLRRVICDRNVDIPAGETIGFDAEADRQRFTVTGKGITVIPGDYQFAKS